MLFTSMNIAKSVYNSFWHESHWWPPGYNWSSLQSTAFERYPQAEDLKASLAYAIIVLAVRCFFERCISKPIGRWRGIEVSDMDAPDILDYFMDFFRLKCSIKVTSINTAMDKRLNLAGKKSTLDKFSECFFRMIVYLSLFIYGLCTLWNKSFLSNTMECWYGFPLQSLTNDVYWYYMFELSFYWSLIISQFFDVYRKDFWVAFIHHIATILLLSFSYVGNFCRMGTIVMLTHDAADPFMETAKMARYTQNFKFSNTMYYTFTFIWIVTRCGFLPFWIIYATLIESVSIIGFYEAYYVLNALLLMLQTLHIIWTVLIIKILFDTVKRGQLEDARSDDEDDGEENVKRE